MKKLMSVLLTVAMLLSLCAVLPVSAAIAEVENAPTSIYLGYESEAEVKMGKANGATVALAEDGVFGSNGAMLVNATNTSGYGTVKYNMSTRPGDIYNISFYLKPVDITFGTINVIFYTNVLRDGKTKDGFETLTATAGETTEDGYTRYYIDEYTMDVLSRNWASTADGGSLNCPKSESDATTIEIRVNAVGSYLVDEFRVEQLPETVLRYANFDRPLLTPAAEAYDAFTNTSTPMHSAIFQASLLPHTQTKYNGDGYVTISGSSTQGAFFSDVTLMPATTYRLSAKVRSTNATVPAVKAYIANPTTTAITSDSKTFSFGSNQMISAGTNITTDGEWHEYEYYFRTKNATLATYSADGFTFDRIGICTNGSYTIWDIDEMCLEEVPEIPFNGDFEKGGYKSNTYCGSTEVPVYRNGDSHTTLTDATDAEHGNYLKVSMPGTSDTVTGTTRRLATCLNLKQNHEYRLSFDMKLTDASVLASGKVYAMYNLGKVLDEGGTNPRYGSITISDNAITKEWKTYTTTFKVQDVQQVGELYIGIDNYAPAQNAEFAIDNIKLEPIGANYYDAVLAKDGETLKATEKTGNKVGNVSDKTYTFYISEDGVNFAKAGTSTTGVYSIQENDIGKFVKSVVSGTKADGTVAKAESNTVKISGFKTVVNGTLTDATLSATVTYIPENDEVKSFDAILAFYGEDNELLNVVPVTADNNVAIPSLAVPEGTLSAKVLIWNSLEGTIPYVKAVEIQ